MNPSANPPFSFRHSLPLDPLGILRRGASMGRTLVGVRTPGALLERIGRFDGVREAGGWIVAEGPAHATRIDPSMIAAIVADRSETPHDTILAYVDFLTADGSSLLKLTALDGIAALDSALEGVPREPLPYVAPPDRSSVAVQPDDAGARPLRAAAASGEPVTLSLSRPGAFQSRTGTIARLHFGHNYINVLQEDLHLHLRGGHVSAWQVTVSAGRSLWTAIGIDGEPNGLTVEGTESAFAAAVPA